MDLLDELSNAVSLYTEYENMFSGLPRFQEALLNVYVDIIVVLRKAQKVLNKRSMSKSHHLILPFNRIQSPCYQPDQCGLNSFDISAFSHPKTLQRSS